MVPRRYEKVRKAACHFKLGVKLRAKPDLSLVFFIVLMLFLHASIAMGAQKSCAAQFRALARFETLARRRLPDHKVPSAIVPWLEKRLFQGQNLSPEGERALAEGKNPLLDRAVRDAMANVYTKLIDISDLSDDRKQELRDALHGALEELERADDHFWAKDDRTIEGPDAKKLKEDLSNYVISDGRRRCLLRATNLVGVSEAVTTLALVFKRRAEYAAPQDQDWYRALTSKQAYAKALQDRYFQLQMVRNGLLMAAIGGLRCFPRRELLPYIGVNPDGRIGTHYLTKKNIVAALAFTFSIMGQKIVSQLSTDDDKKKHWLNWYQVMLDTLFVRGISVYKTDLAYWLSESLARHSTYGIEMWIYDALIQGASETSGAYGSAWIQDKLRNAGILPKK